MRKMLGCAGVLIILGVFVAGFFAYFVRSTDAVTGVSYDGLGRALSGTPALVRFVFGQEEEWAGWQWFALDFVVFWGGIGLVYLLIKTDFNSLTKESPK